MVTDILQLSGIFVACTTFQILNCPQLAGYRVLNKVNNSPIEINANGRYLLDPI